jgi:ADP-ribose pyrophosphatase YjhB (NUDIX family)
MLWLRRFRSVLQPINQLRASLTRGLTLGVRGVVTDAEGRVLLVEHTYTPGWYLPGGGVERGETAETALARELVEEAGVEVVGRPTLMSFHSNERKHPGDHVLIYRVGEWRACKATSRGEIHAVAWFAPDALPSGVTPATRRRIMEVLGGEEPKSDW